MEEDKKYKLAALLPMKFNSERVPGKNFKEFAGEPLFMWILKALIAVEEIEIVVINTDAVSLLTEFGVDKMDKVLLRDRPKEICGDFVSMNKVIASDMEVIKADHYLMTHTTNPLISADTIGSSIQTYYESIEGGYDSLFSVNAFKSRFYSKDVEPVNHDPDNLIRTQDLDDIYEENSCLYIFNPASFTATDSRIGKKPNVYVTPFFESVDIDDHETWKLAEIFQKAKEL